jgi:hypothetical protein
MDYVFVDRREQLIVLEHWKFGLQIWVEAAMGGSSSAQKLEMCYMQKLYTKEASLLHAYN